jgi:hypothetical protein
MSLPQLVGDMMVCTKCAREAAWMPRHTRPSLLYSSVKRGHFIPNHDTNETGELHVRPEGLFRSIRWHQPTIHSLYAGSKSHASAVADTKLLFPDGLCCCDVPAMSTEQVQSFVQIIPVCVCHRKC